MWILLAYNCGIRSKPTDPILTQPHPSGGMTLVQWRLKISMGENSIIFFLSLFFSSVFIIASCPLTLHKDPEQLLQSATPLYLRGKDAIFPKDLLQVRSFPVELRLISMGEIERGIVRNEIQWREEPKEVGSERIDEKLLNLPNLVSISRMVSGPIIGWMIINEWYLPAFGALVVSGATDWLDGFLARKMGIHSVFGSYLDPLADKVLIVCVGLAMLKKDLLNPMLVALIVARDVGLIGGAFYKRAASLGWEWKSWSQFVNLDEMHRHKVEPLLISKVNTVFQLLLVAAALLQPELGNKETQVYITYLSWLVASTTSVSSIAYIAQRMRYMHKYNTMM
ncbi:hypothetical protein ZIOFF_061811 [Zingiber officinale]|uniref:Uncharacterized protein n=1 Tax=Zingiber officinale TaxID=94328 RepID=A0A8J5F8Y9_ZINOF|nr:hypothetical protein ZIOFF_061811 [Zingiber officinale]